MNKLLKMTESELKDYIFNVQNVVKQKLDSGIDIDDFLDETTIFDDFEWKFCIYGRRKNYW